MVGLHLSNKESKNNSATITITRIILTAVLLYKKKSQIMTVIVRIIMTDL